MRAVKINNVIGSYAVDWIYGRVQIMRIITKRIGGNTREFYVLKVIANPKLFVIVDSKLTKLELKCRKLLVSV